MVFLPYWTFAKAHGAHLAFLEALIKARDDMKKEDVSAIMESARRKVKQEGLQDLVPQQGTPTVMSRVAQAHGSGLGSGFAGMAASASSAFGLGESKSNGGSGGSGPGWSSFATNYIGSGWKKE